MVRGGAEWHVSDRRKRVKTLRNEWEWCEPCPGLPGGAWRAVARPLWGWGTIRSNRRGGQLGRARGIEVGLWKRWQCVAAVNP